jgi:hypothetical protein
MVASYKLKLAEVHQKVEKALFWNRDQTSCRWRDVIFQFMDIY